MLAAMALNVNFEADFTRSVHHIDTRAWVKLCEPSMMQGKVDEMMKRTTTVSTLTALGIVHHI